MRGFLYFSSFFPFFLSPFPLFVVDTVRVISRPLIFMIPTVKMGEEGVPRVKQVREKKEEEMAHANIYP